VERRKSDFQQRNSLGMCQMKLAVCVLTFKDQCCFLEGKKTIDFKKEKEKGYSAKMPTQQTETSTELGPNRNTCELTASAPALSAKCHMHPNSKGIHG
jgi:hypothetical protein